LSFDGGYFSINILTLKRYNVDMSVEVKRATIYFDSDLHRAVRLKSAQTSRSISDIVNESLRESLREDQEDLAAFEQRASEPLMSYESLLKKLKADGKI
jgi:hypothetical protein